MSAEKVETNDVGVVKRWLSKHPKRAHALTLTTKDSDGELVELGSWECADVRPEQASDFVLAVDQFAQASERDAVANVVWSDRAGKVLQTRRLKRRAKVVEDESVPPMAGTPMDQAAQAQRHLEKMTQLYYAGIGGAMQQMMRLSEAALTMAQSVVQASAADREEAAQLRAQVQEIVLAQAEGAADAADAAAKEKDEEKEQSPIEQAVGMVIPMLVANATKGASQPPSSGSSGASGA